MKWTRRSWKREDVLMRVTNLNLPYEEQILVTTREKWQHSGGVEWLLLLVVWDSNAKGSSGSRTPIQELYREAVRRTTRWQRETHAEREEINHAVVVELPPWEPTLRRNVEHSAHRLEQRHSHIDKATQTTQTIVWERNSETTEKEKKREREMNEWMSEWMNEWMNVLSKRRQSTTYLTPICTRMCKPRFKAFLMNVLDWTFAFARIAQWIVWCGFCSTTYFTLSFTWTIITYWINGVDTWREFFLLWRHFRESAWVRFLRHLNCVRESQKSFLFLKM